MVDPGIDKIIMFLGDSETMQRAQQKYRGYCFLAYSLLAPGAELRHRLGMLARCDELWYTSDGPAHNMVAELSLCRQYEIPTRHYSP